MNTTEKKGLYSFTVSGEIIKDCGEDSYISIIGDNGRLVLGVFDGCGGLGARRYPSEKNHTGAYIASRLAANSLNDYCNSDTQKLSLAQYISDRFAKEKKRLEKLDGIGRIHTDMCRTLPTTMCALCMIKCDVEIQYIGDSLAYTLDSKGLHRLIGEVNLSDEINNHTDKRLEGCINADESFTFHSKRIKINSPKILFAATDGFYGAYRTPMEFEYMLLNTMSLSSGWDEWKKLLYEKVNEVASDDFTAVFCMCGYENFAKLKSYFAHRYAYIGQKLKPLIDDENYGEYESLICRLWKEYRHDYFEKV